MDTEQGLEAAEAPEVLAVVLAEVSAVVVSAVVLAEVLAEVLADTLGVGVGALRFVPFAIRDQWCARTSAAHKTLVRVCGPLLVAEHSHKLQSAHMEKCQLFRTRPKKTPPYAQPPPVRSAAVPIKRSRWPAAPRSGTGTGTVSGFAPRLRFHASAVAAAARRPASVASRASR